MYVGTYNYACSKVVGYMIIFACGHVCKKNA